MQTLSDPDAEVRVHGEYEAMSAIYQTMPNMAPKPRGCGPCAEKKGTFFFVCDYVNLAHHKMTDEKYRREYFKHYPPSEPREEADDRNRLYSVQTRISTSLDFPGLKMREQIMADLNYLIDKYELRDK
ncbi:hypothetical protein PG987_006780 [Apiospora arundinis]|uniref:Uncharacterized protein n=1 Tax=Apiospora arundinis TaxID=335852 RepID=A0ABR2I9Y8_9PEZI